MSSSAVPISSAVVCGVWHVGSHVVQTVRARRAPSSASQSTEQVRPTANSSRSRYWSLSRLNQKLRLVEPRVYRDLARRHLVVAQRDFDEPAAALRVVVAVDPEHNLVLEGNGRGLSRYEVRDDDLRRYLDGGSLVTAQRLLALLALLGDRHASALLGIESVADVGGRLGGVRVLRVLPPGREPHRRDPTDQIGDIRL